MKKLFLFLTMSALTFSATSCSKDENTVASGSMGTVTFTVDGTTKTFSQIEARNSGDDIMITAFNGASQIAATEQVSFVVQPNKTGYNAIGDLGFSYVITGNSTWTDYQSGFQFNVTDNSTTAKTLKGTFTGTLKEYNGEKPSKAITNGTFDVKYQLITPPSK